MKNAAPDVQDDLETRFPITLIAQVAAHLLAADNSPAENEDERSSRAAYRAVDLVEHCFFAREMRALQMAKKVKAQKLLFSTPPHLPFAKGVNFITGSKQLSEKLPTFKKWLEYEWLNFAGGVVHAFYSPLATHDTYQRFVEAAITTMKANGFTAAAVIEFQYRFSMFHRFSWLPQQRSKAGRAGGIAKKSLE